MFGDRTADVTCCADVTLFLHTTLGWLQLSAAYFLCLVFYFFKCYLASCSRCKLCSSNVKRPKHAEQDQTDANLLRKKVIFLTWRSTSRWNHTIANNSKNKQKIRFVSVATLLVKMLLLVFIRWNKNRSYTEKNKKSSMSFLDIKTVFPVSLRQKEQLLFRPLMCWEFSVYKLQLNMWSELHRMDKCI